MSHAEEALRTGKAGFYAWTTDSARSGTPKTIGPEGYGTIQLELPTPYGLRVLEVPQITFSVRDEDMKHRTRRRLGLTAWLFLLYAALLIVDGTIHLAVYEVTGNTGLELLDSPKATDSPIARINSALQHEFYAYLKSIQVAIGLILVFTTYMYMRRQSWARTALETGCWLQLLHCVGLAVTWIINMNSAFPNIKAVGALFMVGCMIVWAFVVIGTVKFLRRKAIRQLFR